MASIPELRPTRRAVLAGLGGVGGSLLLAACGSSSSTSTAGTTRPPAPDLALAPRFDTNDYAVAGGEQRLVVSVVTKSGDTPANLPKTLDFTVLRDGTPIGPPISTAAHADGVPISYFPIRFTPTQPGTYSLSTTLDGQPAAMDAFKIQAPAALPLLQPGQKMRVTDTPTTADARGVKPICTRQANGGAAPCALHEVNLRDALATGRPTALMISTPAYCQIGVCGPVLELLLELRAAYPTVQFVHAEVYRDPASGSHDTAPIVDAYGLNFEPSLFLAAADGTVVERLDFVFDRTEIKAGLDKIAA